MSQRRAKQAGQTVRGARPAPPGRGGSGTPKWLWIALAAVAVGAVVAVGVLRAGSGGAAGASPRASEPEAAPELSGTDPISGKEVSLDAYAGKPIVLNVWASWCPGCNEEAADLRKFAKQHPEAQVIGIDYQDTKSGAASFYKRWSWSHPSIFDPSGELANELGLQGLPTTVFLDAQHRIVTRIVGATTLSGFEEGLRAAKKA